MSPHSHLFFRLAEIRLHSKTGMTAQWIERRPFDFVLWGSQLCVSIRCFPAATRMSKTAARCIQSPAAAALKTISVLLCHFCALLLHHPGKVGHKVQPLYSSWSALL